ncbi:lipoprotein BA_5634 family protein [Rossellomorea sp. BNER]|uniref:lipoprotein BA_5634 family protein n=1 Tax=Rossellomorea sp. BNER TaxID=2962031 RepID=UPI003AF2D41A|nr:lipoprotein BA_5634 family protein [Rossellomorea sp. BNER]
MKKLLSVCFTAVIAGSLMTGCSAITEMFEKANGVILYGDHKQVAEVFEQEKDDLKEKNEYKFKVAEDQGQQILIFNETTAKALVEKELLNKVVKDDETEPIKSLPELKDKGILFTKQDNVDKVTIDGQSLSVSNEGNIVIGRGRAYGDMFLVVSDDKWSAMMGTEKVMGVIEYDKDPAEKLPEFEVEKVQLITIND